MPSSGFIRNSLNTEIASLVGIQETLSVSTIAFGGQIAIMLGIVGKLESLTGRIPSIGLLCTY